jgi:uncharacterized repeat protein (TIGR01451 family)
MKKARTQLYRLLVVALIIAIVPAAGAPRLAAQGPTTVFVNEIHYDNDGTDTGEAIEVAGPAGTDLTGWSLVLYNGYNGTRYGTVSLSGAIPDQQAGYGTLSYFALGLQNGSPDGLALVDASNNVLQFLSYEGTFAAVDGPAAGMTSTDIGVSEPSDSPVGFSLQLSGTGTVYEDFVWNAPAASTFGAVNTEQTFGVTSSLEVSKTAPSLVAPGEDFTYTITATNGTDMVLTNLVITDTVPANATYVPDSASDGGTFDGSVVQWTVGNLAAGASVLRTFEVTASETNGVTIVNDDYGAVADEWPTPAMGSPVTTEVWESIPTDIVVVKSGPSYAMAGETLAYTLVVSNTSVTDAEDVYLVDTLPPGSTYIDDNIGEPLNPSPAVYSWALGTVPAGAQYTYHLTATVNATVTLGTVLTNLAEVSTTTGETDLADNSDDWTTTVYAQVTIAEARGLPLGTAVMVEGTVTAEPGIFVDYSTNRKLYMEDGTAGILVYLETGLNPVARSNRVRVLGLIDGYRTETELVPLSAADVVDLGPAAPIIPAEVDTGAVDESMEGELLQVTGLIVAKPTTYQLQVDDGSGIVWIYRYYNLGQTTDPNYIDFAPYEVGDYISATGPSRGYDYSGVVRREILPRGPEDLEELAAASLSIAKDVLPSPYQTRATPRRRASTWSTSCRPRSPLAAGCSKAALQKPPAPSSGAATWGPAPR